MNKHIALELRVRRVIIVLLTAGAAAATTPARADFKVWQPDAEPGETAIENIGSYGQDSRNALNNEQSYTLEFEHGVNEWWRTELEFEFNREPGPGHKTIFNQLTTENVFQFTERGEYWLDAGMYWEFGKALTGHTPDETTFGPILRKEFAGTINTLNLFLQKDVGGYSDGRPYLEYAWETRLALGTPIEPGIQLYGAPGPLFHFAKLSEQDQRIGPQLFGNWHNLGPGSLKFNAGLLFGLTPASPRRTLRWQLEYEVHF